MPRPISVKWTPPSLIINHINYKIFKNQLADYEKKTYAEFNNFFVLTLSVACSNLEDSSNIQVNAQLLKMCNASNVKKDTL